MNPISLDEVRQALGDAFKEGDGARVDLRPVQAATRLPAPTAAEALGALDEAVYASFAADLGITPDDQPIRLVTVPRDEYDRLVAEAASLTDHLKQRPADVSPQEQADYERFVAEFGLRV